MKVIFLDFDGVLHNRESIIHGSGLASHAHPECVAALNRIVEETGAKIVVSSMWRMGCNVSELREMLGEWGFEGEIIGKTPFNNWGLRGYEIQDWLNKWQDESVDNFVILDDDSDMAHLKPKLVQSTFTWGLTEQLADIAIAKLNGTLEEII